MKDLAPSGVAAGLRAFTPARVGLARTGVSQQTRDVLDFQRAHALARDAVHAGMNYAALARAVASIAHRDALLLHSAAAARTTYLQRPDLGRMLDETSCHFLAARDSIHHDLAIVICDGLSALAVERHAIPLLESLLPRLVGWVLAPVSIVEQGRVAIGDEIGELLAADLAIVLIGERPGLSSPDSLGAYITWMPRRGRTDAERVCISNIRADGLSSTAAAALIHAALEDARSRRLTGVALAAMRALSEGGPL
jgi:ethanolamine ammonia-lyase small subunit